MGQALVHIHRLAYGAVPLAMQGISEAVSINCAQLVLNQIPLGLLDHGLSTRPRVRPVFIWLDHLRQAAPNTAIGHAVEAGKPNEITFKAVAGGAGVIEVGATANRLAHHIDANGKLAFPLATSHLVRETIVVIEAHLLDSSDAAGVEHDHVVVVSVPHLLKRQIIAHKTPDLLRIASVGREPVARRCGSVERAGLRAVRECDDGRGGIPLVQRRDELFAQERLRQIHTQRHGSLLTCPLPLSQRLDDVFNRCRVA